MNSSKSIEVYVLAGGKSSRMGQDKGMILFQNKPMIQHILDEVKNMKLPINIVANNNAYKTFGFPVLKDIVQEKGPLGGILTAMNHSQADEVLILSCDMPFMTSKIIHHLISKSDQEQICVAQSKEQLHPLCAIYKLTLKFEIEKRIAHGQLKMLDLILGVQSKIVNMDIFEKEHSDAFVNINKPKDLVNFEN